MGPDGSIRSRRDTRTPVEQGADAIVAACVTELEHVLAAEEARGILRAEIQGVGISAPGPVDPIRGTIVDPPNLGPAFRDIPLAARVREALGLATVIDRDTQVAAIGEGAAGAARGCRDYLYVTVSTGIGGAIVSDGRLLRGPDGSAGELGHLVVDRNGPLCGCGAAGHLEAIASGSGIARAAREAVDRGESPLLAGLIKSAGLAFGAREVVAAAGSGDEAAGRIVDDACAAFAAASVSLIDVFNPDLVVVGGSLARGLGERLLGPARESVRDLSFRSAAQRVRFVPSALGDDVGLIGAAVLLAQHLARREGDEPPAAGT